jgi:sporulation protein YlmC with PRC-barrel domain
VFAPEPFGHDGRGMKERRGDELLGLPVRLHGIQLGRPVELLLDRDTMRVIGLDVRCGDGVHRFLPLTTALLSASELSIRSPLVLLEGGQLDFYRSRTLGLGALRGRAVEGKGGGTVGTLVDVVLAPDGALVALIVEQNGSKRSVPYDGTLVLPPKRRSAA